MKLESISIDDLIFDPNNARKHSAKNVDAIKGSLTKFGQQKPIVVDAKNIIIAGNGTVAAAKELGWKSIQAVRSTLDGFMQSAFAIADNRTAELAEWDFDVLKESLAALDLEDFDLSDIGFTDKDLDFIDDNTSFAENSVEYTKKVEAPIYEIKGEKPKLTELLDKKKYEELISEIEKSKISEEEKSFLKLAASRHVVFNYEAIAEFYAHGAAETQRLMEDSALVIIDFDKAIEKGFVELTKHLAETYDA